MREFPNVNEIGKTDSGYNIDVRRLKGLAALQLIVNDYIVAIRENMTIEEARALREKKEYVVSSSNSVNKTKLVEEEER